MKSVGVKTLKDNLSKYLRLVREGETIWVTDRDEVVAEIHRPTSQIPGRVSPWIAFLNEETRKGGLTPAATGPAPPIGELNMLPRPEVPVDLSALLEEIKGA